MTAQRSFRHPDRQGHPLQGGRAADRQTGAARRQRRAHRGERPLHAGQGGRSDQRSAFNTSRTLPRAPVGRRRCPTRPTRHTSTASPRSPATSRFGRSPSTTSSSGRTSRRGPRPDAARRTRKQEWRTLDRLLRHADSLDLAARSRPSATRSTRPAAHARHRTPSRRCSLSCPTRCALRCSTPRKVAKDDQREGGRRARGIGRVAASSTRPIVRDPR